MPNPLLSVRIPPELDVLIQQKEAEGQTRSEITIAALSQFLKPSTPEEQALQIYELKKRIEVIERLLRQREMVG